MRKFLLSEDVKDLQEMAAPKMPEGVKRSRSKELQGVHNIHIDGQHVGTIVGHGNHYQSRHSAGRTYEIHKDEASYLKGSSDIKKAGDSYGHPDHLESRKSYGHPARDAHGNIEYGKPYEGVFEYKKPKAYGSMDHAVESLVHSHRNNKEFGKGHSPHVRWQKAIDSASGLDAHKETARHLKSAVSSLKAAGHHDLANQAQEAHDKHLAGGAGNGASKEKIDQWTHDANHYSQTKWHSPEYTTDGHRVEGSGGDIPVHPEHYALATKALNVRSHGHPDGPSWMRNK